MDVVITYRGREITHRDCDSIRALIESNPTASRRALSIKLCEAWSWRQPNGATKDAICRGMLLTLHRAGHIELPSPRWKSNGVGSRHTKRAAAIIELDMSPIEMGLRDLGKLELRQVRRSDDEKLFEGLLQAHHYLGYTRPVGEHLKFMIFAGERPIACFLWTSAPRHLKPRDRYIGWSAQARRENVGGVVYNSRFLILPWVRVPHLASHLLGKMARRLSSEWEAVYHHPVWFAETFVDTDLYKGTCYKAANWVYLGDTTGRGKDDQTHRANRSKKAVYGLALRKGFRELLGSL